MSLAIPASNAESRAVQDVSLRRGSDAGRGAPAAGSAPQPDVPRPRGPTATPTATLATLASVGARFNAALATGDPAVIMTVVASQLRDAQLSHGETAARSNDQQRQDAFEQQTAAYRRAEAAQRDAQTWGLIGKIGAYVGAALAAVAGVASAVFTGGVGTLGGIALAATLITSASTIGMTALQDTGVIRGTPPREAGIAIGVVALIGTVCSFGTSSGSALAVVGQLGRYVGAAAQAANLGADVGVALGMDEPPAWFRYVTAGAGLAGAGASMAGSVGGVGQTVTQAAQQSTATAQAVQQSARVVSRGIGTVREIAGQIRTVAQVGQGAALVTRGVGTVGTAERTHASDEAHVDATTQRNRLEVLDDDVREVADGLQLAAAVFDRSARRASELRRRTDDARRAVIQNLGRG